MRRLPTILLANAGALFVIDAKRRTLVIAKVEFGKVALQMLLADVVIRSDDAPFEDREVALNRVGVSIAAHVFIGAVVDRFVAVELFATW